MKVIAAIFTAMLMLVLLNVVLSNAGPLPQRVGTIVALAALGIVMWFIWSLSRAMPRAAIAVLAVLVLLVVVSNAEGFLPFLGALLLIVLGHRIVSSQMRSRRLERERTEQENAEIRARIEKEKAEIIDMIDEALRHKAGDQE